MTILCALDGSDDVLFGRYTAKSVACDQIGPNHRMIVNSFPKSGSVWLAAMLHHLFPNGPSDPPLICHVNDIQGAGQAGPVFGVVVLVRDLRDVVLSWHNELQRNDRRAGFKAPRYPAVEDFYFEYLIGYLQSRERFALGKLDAWLDAVTGMGFPLIRYEDMRQNSEASLGKILRFWKVDVDAADISRTVAALDFKNMRQAASGMGGVVGEMLPHGHLNKAEVGRWRENVPLSVTNDIMNRFDAFQRRLGYI